MKNTSLTPVLAVLSLALGGWGFWEHSRRTETEQKLAKVRVEAETLRNTASQKIALLSDTEVDPKGPRGLHADGSPVEDGDKKNPEAEKAPNPAAGFAEMMKDPAMRDAIKSQTRAQLEVVYRDLFDMLGLDADQQSNLETLLAKRQDAMMEGGLAMWQGEKPTEEQGKAMKDALEKSKEEIKAALGEEKYAKFEAYEDSQGERMQLKTFSGMLKDQKLNLSEDAESKLMDAMFQERKNTKYETDFSKPEAAADMSKLTENSLDKYTSQSADLRERILKRAEGILSPEEMAVFRKAQEQQAKMEEMGMNMTKQLVKGQKAKEGAPDSAH